MKFFYTVLFLFFGFFISFAQSTKFKFDIDGDDFLSFKVNVNGFYHIHHNDNDGSMFFGYDSGTNNIHNVFQDGKRNTAFGNRALKYNTIGYSNTAVGSTALMHNITGLQNVGIGTASLWKNESGNYNIGIGQSAVYSNIEGESNIGIGSHTLNMNRAGNYSIAIGRGAGSNDTLSTNNIYIGHQAGRGTIFPNNGFSRSKNVMLGSFSGYESSTSGNVFIGYSSGRNAKADNQLYITNSNTDSLNTLIYGQFDDKLLRINGDLNIDGLYTLPKTAPSSGDYLRYNGGSYLIWDDITHPWELALGDDLIYEDGFVGIGTYDADFKLHVEGSGSGTTGGYLAMFRNTTNSTTDSRGIQIQLGPNTNPNIFNTYVLFRDGNGTTIGSVKGNGSGGVQYATTSDRRLKQNIKTFDKGLETLARIRPTSYQMKSNPTVDEIGFIAQELASILPIAVGGLPDGDVESEPMTVDYSRLTPILVAALKEQQVLINKLSSRLDQKDEEYNELKAVVSSLQKEYTVEESSIKSK